MVGDTALEAIERALDAGASVNDVLWVSAALGGADLCARLAVLAAEQGLQRPPEGSRIYRECRLRSAPEDVRRDGDAIIAELTAILDREVSLEDAYPALRDAQNAFVRTAGLWSKEQSTLAGAGSAVYAAVFETEGRHHFAYAFRAAKHAAAVFRILEDCDAEFDAKGVVADLLKHYGRTPPETLD